MNKKRVLLSVLMLCLAFVTGWAQQPFGGCWHPDFIKDWTPEKDPDAKFNRSTVPLQPRFYDDGIKANPNQFYDGKVAACLTMNPMCSQTPSQGANNFIGYNPNEWQYMDLVVWWGGSAGEGIIIPPSAPVIDAAHLNGVKILGNVFFPTTAHGGQAIWVEQMLTREGDAFPYAKKLYEIAKYYGFDGWFINEETVGGNTSTWTEFIKYFYQCAEADGDTNMEIQWYDMGTSVGYINNILTTSPRTSYMANYGSANYSTINNNMTLIQSWGYTREEALKKLYSGIECAQQGLYGNKSAFINLFATGQHRGSIQMFNPEEHTWKDFVKNLLNTPNAQGPEAYAAMSESFARSAYYFVNAANDPSDVSGRSKRIWPGLSNAIQERSTIQNKPFVTSFSMGLGKHRFVNGEKRGTQDWYHRGMQDILPTWRWWIEPANGGAKSDLSAVFNWDDAYNVGTSLIIKGTLKAEANYLMRLFKTKLPIAAGDKLEIVYKGDNLDAVQLKLATSDNVNSFVTVPLTATTTQNGWGIATADLSSLAGKTLSVVALNFNSASEVANFNIKLGQLGIMPATYAPSASPVTNLRAQNELKEEISDIRLIWDAPADIADIHHYNVYLERNGEKNLVGQTRNEGFYIPKFTRTSGEQSLKLYVTTVTKDLKEGNEVSMTMDFPAMTAPTVSLKASKTLAKKGEEITFTAIANNNPTTYTWTVPTNAELVSQTGNQAVMKFNEEGKYDIKVNVANKAGNTDCTVEKYVEVSELTIVENVAQGKVIDSVSGFLDIEEPKWLLDGIEVPNGIHNKWCIGGKKEHWVVIDLASTYRLYQFKIFDCGHKENASDNFRNYKIELSMDGKTWTEAINEKNIPATAAYNTKEGWIKPTVARYIRFTPYDEEMPITIRIWEFQAYGTSGNISVEPKSPVSLDYNATDSVSVKYSLGGDDKASNFNVEVKAEDPLVELTDIVVDNDSVSFVMKAGETAGKTRVVVSVTNGDFTKQSIFNVTVNDPGNKNLLLGMVPSVTEDGTEADEMNIETNASGPIGYKGLSDGDETTWWSSKYSNDNNTKQVMKYDLAVNHIINSFRVLFDAHDYQFVPTKITILGATTDDDASYKELAVKEITTHNDIEDFKLTPTSKDAVRYLKFEIENPMWYGFSLAELEAWGATEAYTGVDKVQQESFAIYPNPVRRGETFTLKVENGSLVQVISMQGQVLISEKAVGNTMNVSTASLPAGTYIVTNVSQKSNAKRIAKLIVRN